MKPTPYALYAVSAGEAASVRNASVSAPQLNTPGPAGNGQVLSYNGGGLFWTNYSGGSGAFSLNGSSAYYNGGNVGIGTANPSTALEVRGALTLNDVGSPGIFTGIGGSELNRYLTLLNTPTSPSASGLKAGGVLVADSFGYANPGKNDLIVKGKVGIGTASPDAPLNVEAAWDQAGTTGVPNIDLSGPKPTPM